MQALPYRWLISSHGAASSLLLVSLLADVCADLHRRVHGATVLEFDLSKLIEHEKDGSPLAKLASSFTDPITREISVDEFVRILEAARQDKRVRGLVLRGAVSDLSHASVATVVRALRRFRRGEKDARRGSSGVFSAALKAMAGLGLALYTDPVKKAARGVKGAVCIGSVFGLASLALVVKDWAGTRIRGGTPDYNAGGRKFVVLHGHFVDVKTLRVSTAADATYLAPAGMIAATTLSAEYWMKGKLLERLGVVFDVGQRREFKSALETFSRTSLSEPNRLQIGELLDDLRRSSLRDFALKWQVSEEEAERRLQIATVGETSALHTLGLCDGVVSWNELFRERPLLRRDGDALRLAVREASNLESDTMSHLSNALRVCHRLALSLYAEHNKAYTSGKVSVAHVTLTGAISDGTDGRGIKGARDAALLRKLRKTAPSGVIVSIDSPGGSGAASEEVLRELWHLRRQGCRVVVKMGAVAASGGYWISMLADRIVASEDTITGSIGVIFGIPKVRRLLEEHLSMCIETVLPKEGRAPASLLSLTQPTDDSDVKLREDMLDDMYQTFVSRVASARDMSFDQLEQLARGRVYSGARAYELNLVDALGDLVDAVNVMATLLGVPPAAVALCGTPPSLLPPRVLDDASASVSWKSTVADVCHTAWRTLSDAVLGQAGSAAPPVQAQLHFDYPDCAKLM
ncbi:MAG: hypothetical protein MHM6MM_001260 [Cercozoa sp. M6MM]